MNNIHSISIYLDTRRKKKSGKYPVKLRVFSSTPRTQKLYPTKFEYSTNEFQSIWETTKPRTEYKEARNKLLNIELNANNVANRLEVFTFEQFEKKLFQKTGEGNNVYYQFQLTIEKLKKNKQLSTAEVYELSIKSIKNFLLYKKGKIPTKITFYEITVDWLEEYESYMIEHLKRSRNTASIYLRAFRAIYNNTIADKEISNEYYPFGKRKYEIPSSKSIKKALNKSELKLLLDSKPQTPEQIKAKDFWFFSYICNGMNIKDIAYLQYSNIQDDKIVFFRAKTINTKKTDLRPVTVYLTDLPKSIIKKYGNQDKEQYIFSIIDKSQSIEEQHRKVKNFTRFLNQNIKKLAVSIGLTDDISSYTARYSFSTYAINNGASMEFVSEALNHSNVKITQGYFKGFEDSTKKELMDKMMDFD